jgi:hypothetical protein
MKVNKKAPISLGGELGQILQNSKDKFKDFPFKKKGE